MSPAAQQGRGGAAQRPPGLPPDIAQGLQTWRLDWAHGQAEVQSLGGMLGPLTFRLPDRPPLPALHVAPWAGTARAQALPALLQRLRGEWPCVPFGRVDLPQDLPVGWSALTPDDAWVHGYAAHHHWQCLAADASQLVLGIDYPAGSPIASLQRRISAEPGAAALSIELTVHARRDACLPIGLHPTFALPQAVGRVQVLLGGHQGIHSYPSQSAGARGLAAPDVRSAGLDAVMGEDGNWHDLSRLPLGLPAEVLLQVKGLRAPSADPLAAPLRLRHLDHAVEIGLWWDQAQLPDLMLWISNGGRPEYPWQGRHLALGAEPVNSVFDLGRVARPPDHHPLAACAGLTLKAGHPLQLNYRIAARAV